MQKLLNSKRAVSLLLIFSILVSLVISASASALSFQDVSAASWYYDDVKYACENGLVNGRSATSFAPNASMTCAEAIKLAACLHQKYVSGKVTLTNGSPWYETYVQYARDEKLITRDYSWNEPITRADYMEIFSKVFPLAAINSIANGSIPDVPMTHPQAAAIYALYRAGIVNGVDSERNCAPDTEITRSEVAAVLRRMLDSNARSSFTLGYSSEGIAHGHQPNTPSDPDEPDAPDEPDEPVEPVEPVDPVDPEEPKSLRQQVVDYMYAMGTIRWTPSEDMNLTSIMSGHTFKAGVEYTGLPYVNEMDSTLEEFQYWLNEDGAYTGPTDALEVIGVDCSSSVLAAWATVSSSFCGVWTWQILPYNTYGGLPVGDYNMPEQAVISPESERTTTARVIEMNDEQTIYKAYAQLLPGDAVVTYTTAGHTRMVAEEPVILYTEEGSISGDSYLITHEIGHTAYDVNGDLTCWNLNHKYVFSELLRTSYIPITCQELVSGESAEPTISVSEENTAESLLENGLRGTLSSNYRIFSVSAQIINSRGETVRSAIAHPINNVNLTMGSKSYELAQLNDDLYFDGLGSGSYTLSLTALINQQEETVLEISFKPENDLRKQVTDYLQAMYKAPMPYADEAGNSLEEFQSNISGSATSEVAAILTAWSRVSTIRSTSLTGEEERLVPVTPSAALPGDAALGSDNSAWMVMEHADDGTLKLLGISPSGWAERTISAQEAEEYTFVTCFELAENAIEAVTWELNRSNTEASVLENGLCGVLSSNYRIFTVTASVTDSQDKTVVSATLYPEYSYNRFLDLSEFNERLALDMLDAGDYTLTVSFTAGGKTCQALRLLLTKSEGVRKIVTDMIREMATIEWKASASFGKFTAGNTYYGMPWDANNGYASIFEMNDDLLDGVYTYSGSPGENLAGINLPGAVWAAWLMVTPNWAEENLYGVQVLNLLKNGSSDQIVAVGNYDPNLSTEANGEQTMYAAYAQLQPGDAVIAPSTYIFAVTAAPTVVYLDDGSIDGENSYIYVTYPDNMGQNKWYVNTEMSFQGLYTGHVNGYSGTGRYLYPVTTKALAENKIETVTWTLSDQDVAAQNGLSGTLKSNFRIYEARTELVDDSNQVLMKSVYTPSSDKTTNTSEIELYHLNAGLNFHTLTDGRTYTLKLYAYAAAELRLVESFTFQYNSASASTTYTPADAPEPNEISDLRAYVVEQFRAMATIAWTPSEAFGKYEVGKTYYGLPWVNHYDASLMEFEASLVDGVYTGGTTSTTILGVDLISCITGVYGLVEPAFSFVEAKSMLSALREGNQGLVPVGNYDPNKTAAENGEQTMYEAYALLQPGDVVVANSTFALMITGTTKVVRNEDGTINGDESEIYATQPDNSNQNGWYDRICTFNELYTGLKTSSGTRPERFCYPATIPSLVTADAQGEEKDKLEAATLTLTGAENVNLLRDGKLTGTLTSNYRIYKIVAELVGEDGVAFQTICVYPQNVTTNDGPMLSKSYDLSQLNLDIASLEQGTYTLTLSAHVATELELVGTYRFTK